MTVIAANGFQAGLWYLNQARPDLPMYAMPMVLRFRGPVDPAGVRAAGQVQQDSYRMGGEHG